MDLRGGRWQRRFLSQLMGSVLSSQSRLASSRGFSSWVERCRSALGLVVAAKSGGGEAERNRGQVGTAARLSPVGMKGRGCEQRVP